jgi:lysophospholipase L1-like esterase
MLPKAVVDKRLGLLMRNSLLKPTITGDVVPSNGYECKSVSASEETTKIYSHASKNLFAVRTASWSGTTIDGITFTLNADNSITVAGTATANPSVNICGAWNVNNVQFIAKAGHVYYPFVIPTGSVYFSFYNLTQKVYETKAGNSFIPQADTNITQILLTVGLGATVNMTVYPQMTVDEELPYEKGVAVTAYDKAAFKVANVGAVNYTDAGTLSLELIKPLTAVSEDVSSLESKVEVFNPLYGKTAVFHGDSICNGASAGDGKSGWAGRIGRANNMAWVNYGVSGSTIAYVSGSYYCVSRNVENMLANADYIILEGGTNDADLLPAEKVGTLSNGFAATLDDTTFYGAMESMFKKAILKYSGKKIGYIIPQKMGVNADSQAKRKAFFDKAVEVCIKWGIPYLDLWNGTHLNAQIAEINTALYTDGQHLNSAGYEAITPRIEAWMKSL